MDISLVRSRFQRKIDFFIANNDANNINQMRYSLQQESTKSLSARLYVSSHIDPKLEGEQLNIRGQIYLVYKTLKEFFSRDTWTYQLLPLSEKIVLKQLLSSDTAIGAKLVNTDGNTTLINGNDIAIIDGEYPAFVNDRISDESRSFSIQPFNASEITVYIKRLSKSSLKNNYDILYNDLRYKIKSKLNVFGATMFTLAREI